MCSASVVLPEPVWPTKAARSVTPGISASNGTRVSALVAIGLTQASDRKSASFNRSNFDHIGRSLSLRCTKLNSHVFERVHDRVQLFIRRSNEIALRDHP